MPIYVVSKISDALNDAGLHMTAAWHRPVKAVLDHFKLDHVTLAGLSMGGCLVMRAAAFEPRVDRVVAYDVYPDALDTTLRQVNTVQRVLLKNARKYITVKGKAGRQRPLPLGPWRWVAAAILTLWLLLTIEVPLSGIALRAFRRS